MQGTRFRHVIGALERVPFDARTHFVGLLALIVYCVYEVVASLSHCDVWKWDWPAISALGLILIGIRVAAGIDGLLSHALRRLYVRGVMACSEGEVEHLNRTVALRRRKWAPVSGIAIGLAIGLAFAMSWKWGVACRPAPFEPLRMALLAVEAPIFYAAGTSIGRTVVQGRLARVLRTLDVKYSVQPGHPGGAAGLRPLGDFFFRQAILAGLPAAYVAFWLAFFPHCLTGTTKPVFLILLPIFLLVEVAAFVWPMWASHRAMARQKRSFVTQADEMARRISSAQAELRGTDDPAQVRELNARLTLDLRLYEELEGLPTRSVSKQIRRRFALQNLTLVAMPVLSPLFSGRDKLFEAVQLLFSGG
jgi:hypothetical protein